MTSGKHLPPFEKVRKITFSRFLDVKSMCIHFSDNVFPVGYNYVTLKVSDKESPLAIKHLKGESAALFGEIFGLPDLESLEIRQDRFTMTFTHMEAWRKNYESFRKILRTHFPTNEVMLR